MNIGDSPDLEALFDSIVQSNQIESSVTPAETPRTEEPASGLEDPAK